MKTYQPGTWGFHYNPLNILSLPTKKNQHFWEGNSHHLSSFCHELPLPFPWHTGHGPEVENEKVTRVSCVSYGVLPQLCSLKLWNRQQISSTNISGIYLHTYLHSYCSLMGLVPPSLFPCKAIFKKKYHIASRLARRNVLEPFLPLLRQQLSVPFTPPPALVCIAPVFISPFVPRWPCAQRETLPVPTESMVTLPHPSCK